MKTLYARHKWMQIVFGALFLLAGIAVIVIEYNWPDYTDRSLSVSVTGQITLIDPYLSSLQLPYLSLQRRVFSLVFSR